MLQTALCRTFVERIWLKSKLKFNCFIKPVARNRRVIDILSVALNGYRILVPAFEICGSA